MALARAGNMPRYSTDLRARAKRFAIDVYQLSKEVRRTHPALRNYAEQLADAAASVGANLAEIEGFSSRRELAARYAIALKESREALYWLEVVEGCEPALRERTTRLAAECKEFIAMTSAALKKLRAGPL